jgi:ABC-type arginine transport system, permease component
MDNGMFDLKGYSATILDGAWITLEVALLSVLVAAALGMMGALAKLSKNRLAKGIATFYTTLVRGIPDFDPDDVDLLRWTDLPEFLMYPN